MVTATQIDGNVKLGVSCSYFNPLGKEMMHSAVISPVYITYAADKCINYAHSCTGTLTIRRREGEGWFLLGMFSGCSIVHLPGRYSCYSVRTGKGDRTAHTYAGMVVRTGTQHRSGKGSQVHIFSNNPNLHSGICTLYLLTYYTTT